jgi:thiamine pyrophosphate-dependent acetolactate synthase large subunit-like protein
MHEESSVAMAHGYAKAAGKPMAILAHGTVGLQHAAMAVYNAWCDRVPLMISPATFSTPTSAGPAFEWYHCVQDPAALLRDFTKWDDQPASLQHFAESVMRGYKIATSPPMAPVVIAADGYFQEAQVQNEKKLHIPKLTRAIPPQGDSGALVEAAKMLVAAERPVIHRRSHGALAGRREAFGRVGRSVERAGLDIGGRMNFPPTHYLNHSGDRRAHHPRSGCRASARSRRSLGSIQLRSATRTMNTAVSAKRI